MDHSMQMMRKTMPDLAAVVFRARSSPDSGGPRTERKRRRLSPRREEAADNYKKDEDMMGKRRELLADDVEVYEFALSRYDKQWTEPLQTC